MRIVRVLTIIAVLCILLIFSGFHDNDTDNQLPPRRVDPEFLKESNDWSDSVFNTLTLDQRLGQLFMVAAFSNREQDHVEEITKLITENNIGGLIFMQGGPARQIKLTNYYQSMSKVPLLIAMDAEWGPAMRLDSLTKFQYQMMMGAIQEDGLVFDFGVETARQLKRLGVHVNFAPVIDVNNNPKNPIISARSFGENKEDVLKKGLEYMYGLQYNRIIAVGKHFPGHGDTDKDSHKTLPVISHNWEHIDSLELYPFKNLIKKGLAGIMTAHLFIPALDTTENLASSLSRKVVDDLLKDELGFNGLVFTDALNMEGVAKFFEPGEVDARALVAGNDILLFSADVPKAIERIKEAMNRGEISEKEINRRVKKILKAKYWVELNKFKPLKTKNVISELNNANTELLKRKLIEASLSLLKNEDDIIPIKELDKKKITCISIWDGKPNRFQEVLSLYDSIDNVSVPSDLSEERFTALTENLAKKNLVIVSIHSSQRSVSGNFDISPSVFKFVENLGKKTNVVLAVFANPYCLGRFSTLTDVKAVIMAYEDGELFQDLTAQLIFGGIPAKGLLPVSASREFAVGSGVITKKAIRLKYSIPEELGIQSQWLKRIDSIAENAISEKATPGCQVLIAKNGVVFYQKSFGYQTYDNKKAVTNNDIYDLASVTKIISSVASLMKLQEEGKFNIDDKLSKYLPYLSSSNKKDMVAKEVLTHQAQLTAWIPFWTKTVKDTALYRKIYSPVKADNCFVQVSDKLYIAEEYRDSMYAIIASSELLKKKEYKYSDVGYFLFQDIIEKQTGEKLNDYVSSTFYRPLGATTLGYKPLDRFSKDQIAPTEDDKRFRGELIQGHVHDPGAAMMGGVAGHAGVFSNSNDLAKMMQMYMNKGTYGDVCYFKDSTVNLFNTSPYKSSDNRRGIGFDKPQMNYKIGGPTCKCISGNSFGHTGFTGTMAWADPDEEVVFIFLSNRICPDENNKKLISMDVRIKIMEEIYAAIKKSKVEKK